MKAARNTKRLVEGTGFRLDADGFSEHERFDGVVDLGEVRHEIAIEDLQLDLAGETRPCTAFGLVDGYRRLSRDLVTAILNLDRYEAKPLMSSWSMPGLDAGRFVIVAFDDDDRQALHAIASASARGRARLVYAGHRHLTVETF